MSKSTHRFRVYEARRTTHPVLQPIEKYTFTIAAKDFPANISTAANARDPVGLNRRIYRDVKESLLGATSVLGTFDLMNKGITILADSVKLVNKEKGWYDVIVDDEIGGIVDGAHTAALIAEVQNDGVVPPEQFVDVYIRTAVDIDLISDIAKGLNTGMQVKTQSIFNRSGVFEWLKEEVSGESYESLISWKESDTCDYDVRDLIGVLEVFNIFDFPNGSGQHPISAYEKWSTPLDKFGDDFEENKDKLSKSKYYKLRGVLKEGLQLWDIIRHEFRTIHNTQAGGSAGKMKIVEQAGKQTGQFNFPFSDLPPCEYRLTKGAAYPMLAAFRNYVELDSKGNAQWRGGFKKVLKVWKIMGPQLVADTFQATKDIGRFPDQLGKNRKHWGDLHRSVENHLLRERLEEANSALRVASGRK